LPGQSGGKTLSQATTMGSGRSSFDLLIRF
jgi:hypothetical protein